MYKSTALFIPGGLFATIAAGIGWLLAQSLFDVAEIAPSLVAAAAASLGGGIAGIASGLAIHKDAKLAFILGAVAIVVSAIVAMLVVGVGYKFEFAASAGSAAGLLLGVNGVAGLKKYGKIGSSAIENVAKKKGWTDDSKNP